MAEEVQVHQCRFVVAGDEYEILVYRRPAGGFVAKTFFGPDDVIVHDGPSQEEVLARHRRLLPLAVDSRQILQDLRREF